MLTQREYEQHPHPVSIVSYQSCTWIINRAILPPSPFPFQITRLRPCLQITVFAFPSGPHMSCPHMSCAHQNQVLLVTDLSGQKVYGVHLNNSCRHLWGGVVVAFRCGAGLPQLIEGLGEIVEGVAEMGQSQGEGLFVSGDMYARL